MSWRDRVGLPGSFRGVPFHVDSSNVSGGRSGPMHKFPGSNRAPFKEDMGTEGDGFRVDCFVSGLEYIAARDALKAALDTPGAGELVHPTYGVKRVAAQSWTISEESSRGGLARFSITFDETSTEPEEPSVSIDASAAVLSSAAAAKASILSEFLAKFNDLAKLKDGAVSALASAGRAVGQVVNAIRLPGQIVADLTLQVEEIVNEAESLATAPEALASAVFGMVEALGDGVLLIADLSNPSKILVDLFGYDPGTRPPDTTPTRIEERTNFDAVHRLVQRAALVQASLIAVEETFTAYDDAVTARTLITAAMDAHAEESSDDTFPALEQLRAHLTQAIPGDALDLPRLVQYTPLASVPSLVLAHRLYGNVDREQDVIDRNKIVNPASVTGGVALEVLSDG